MCEQFGNDHRVSRPGRDIDRAGRRVISQVTPVEDRVGPVEIALVGPGHDYESAVAGIYIGEIGENDEVITVDAPVPAFVARALPSIGFPRAVERSRVDDSARLVHEH